MAAQQASSESPGLNRGEDVNIHIGHNSGDDQEIIDKIRYAWDLVSGQLRVMAVSALVALGL